MASAIVTKLPLNMLTPDTDKLSKTEDARRPRNSTLKRQKVASRTVRQWRQDRESAFGTGGPLNSDSMMTATWSPTPMLVPAAGMPPVRP